MESVVEELSVTERARLENHEETISTGLKYFASVGRALREIRDMRLYRVTHPTFEDYCQDRWDIERAHAYRLISAAGVIERLSPIGDIQPRSESQARPLTKLPPDEQASAWKEAVASAPVINGTPRITAAHVAEVVNNRLPEAQRWEDNFEHIPMSATRELSKGEAESKEYRDVFQMRLAKVTDGAVHTYESLNSVFGSKDAACRIPMEFVAQCEVSPAVKVLRTYGKKGTKQFAFVRTNAVSAHARIKQLVEQIVADPATSDRSVVAAQQILSFLGG